MKKAVVTSFFVFFIALTVALFSGNWWLTFINISFYIAQPLVIIGGFRFIYEKGFFDVTISSFKRLFRSPVERYMTDEQHDDASKRQWGATLFFAGLVVTGATLIFSYMN
ncbi:hypothetical protein KN10_0550 [Anoxybacillus flavithermus NBRC 109594]|uniref:DUF3899 domain-containing protein n=1 Tax=Anoxybacillus flavithermus NBRC 109594 TaxID=1315967 RepID=R4FZU7_9BACL|nr:DUF3899 domain-containing protein [Anoxybacillus flavithermus]GAC90114.1 hypothetical protein KN10_0550 [Anoxybacillus flavithermus NBRC 109594]